MQTKDNIYTDKIRKRESFKRLINLCLSAVCLLLEIGLFAYMWQFYFQFELVDPLQKIWYRGFLLENGIYSVILLFFSITYGGMRLGYLKNSEIIFSQIFATLMADVLIYAELCMMARSIFPIEMFLFMVLLQILAVILYVSIANRIYRKAFPPRELLLIHGDRPIEDICNKFESRKDKYKIKLYEHISIGVDKICSDILQNYHNGTITAVVIWDIDDKDRNVLLKFCYAHSIRVYVMPKISDVILVGAEELHIFDTPILLSREYSLSMEQRFIKRTIDIIGAVILLLITSPLMLLTALVVKLYDRGPVLYKQIRCTIDQKQFYIMKFRSMRIDAEKDGVARLAQKNDNRITPVGRFIRKCRLDELPQLFNILKGDMSFIGPRPERPEIIAQYVEIIPEFVFRMKVKAGLAGFAQVYGKYNTSPYDKLKLDLTYIENYSVWLDLKLMFLTLKVLFMPDSTEGISESQITAMSGKNIRK